MAVHYLFIALLIISLPLDILAVRFFFKKLFDVIEYNEIEEHYAEIRNHKIRKKRRLQR